MALLHLRLRNILNFHCINYNQVRFYCDSENPFSTLESTSLTSLKRGTGGRSSFNGIVATVFGATGFLGRYVCNRLGRSGTQLVIPYRGDWFEVRRLKLGGDLGQVLFLKYELLDEESVTDAVKYSNVVINLVGRDWETKNFTFDCVHVEGARIIAKAAKQAGVKTFIHVSALNSSSEPEPYLLKEGSNFLKSKKLGEEAVREEFPEAIIFRPADIYGQEDRFLRYYCSTWRRQFKWMPLYKRGEETEKQPVFVGDVAHGIVKACTNSEAAGKTYQAVGPTRYLLSELVDWFYRITDRSREWGYWRYALEKDPLFKWRVSINPYLSLGWPKGYLDWEKVERECHSDQLDEGVPTLEDLGIVLTHMEDQVIWELKTYKSHAYYEPDNSELVVPIPPKPINKK